MALEALWAVTFRTGQDIGAGVLVFETGRIFGGDGSYYYVGHYTYNSQDQTISGDVTVKRHALYAPFIFPEHDEGQVQLSGQLREPEMILTGHLVQDPQQQITVHCRHLENLP